VPIPVNQVFKVNDGCALKPRTQAGGWSYVYPLHSYNPDNLILKSQFDKDFEKEVEQSQHDSHEERMARLKIAPRIPSKSTAVSVVFKRNPDVVAEVINRANGKCELCKKNAPFLKSSDGSPYLEVHHWTFLSENGEDTVANATAICPNCHKRAHYGKFRDYIRLNHELPH
jgi:predicted HNH restriction endonuclease